MSKECQICKTPLEDKVEYCHTCGWEQVVVPETASIALKKILNQKQEKYQQHYYRFKNAAEKIENANTETAKVKVELAKLREEFQKMREQNQQYHDHINKANSEIAKANAETAKVKAELARINNSLKSAENDAARYREYWKSANKNTEIYKNLWAKANENTTAWIKMYNEKLPQEYKVINQANCYYLLGNNSFIRTEKQTCYYLGTILPVYIIKNGYALTEGGWIKMTDLEKNIQTCEN